ncbi:unnamed protein product [Blepharisma stoltei]|uniref:Uncharacterized protein n=1 Tax=Blepharisma stoltei TaxID=1481888 RepID=A0AAU9K1C4_9CILI|nr:unnamed protein product [Blepharisma stoltei]
MGGNCLGEWPFGLPKLLLVYQNGFWQTKRPSSKAISSHKQQLLLFMVRVKLYCNCPRMALSCAVLGQLVYIKKKNNIKFSIRKKIYIKFKKKIFNLSN